ncbi:MAG: Si-specific NAD(P)(+) transhydrogenase [Candidatus Hydrogenedentes bacterium]|nr:Si-specific NAD(P)(+) transhydrogenase [Candidatus Hydrogenedentota bacterium]
MPENTEPRQVEVLVIGTGPAGEGAAMQAVKSGKTVAVVERMLEVGGNCTHLATIPSKALRFAIYMLTQARNHPLFQEVGISLNQTFPELRKTAANVIDRQVSMRKNFYVRNGVELLHGNAAFIDPHTVEIRNNGDDTRRMTADSIVIATGSGPYRPPDVDFTHPRVFDSDTILNLSETPRSITIYGAGVIGCEYASMFRNLDVKVNLVNTREHLLEFLDDEITDALSYHMRERGVLIRHMETYTRVEGREDEVVLHLKSRKQLKTDILLWANGRAGNSHDLNLDALGIVPNSRGQIPINDRYQTTSHPHIYVAGDVAGGAALASAAYVQGRYVATVILGEDDPALVRDIPTGIYTSPEISSVGKTERELTEAKIPYEVGHAQFKSLARAQITGQTVGMLKILFHRETLELLGIHCFGSNASEIIHIGQAILSQKGDANSLNYFLNTTFNYPTMAEAYRVAALNGFNRL